MTFFKRLQLSCYTYLLTWILIVLIGNGFRFNDSLNNGLIYISIMIGLPMILITAYVYRLIDESEKTKALLKNETIFFLVATFYGLTFLFTFFPFFLLDDFLFCIVVIAHTGFWMSVFTKYAINKSK